MRRWQLLLAGAWLLCAAVGTPDALAQGTPTRIATLQGHESWVMSVAFSPDGRTLASGSIDGTVKLWDIVSRNQRKTLTGHASEVYSVAFSPDGRTLASGSWDHTVKLWDVPSGSLRASLRGHTDWVIAVAFSPDGSTIVSGSEDKTVKLWDTSSGILRTTLQGHAGSVRSVAFSLDARTLASASTDTTVKLWDAASGSLRATLEHTHGVSSVAFSPDGRSLASGSGDHTVKLWDVVSGSLRETIKDASTVLSVAFSPDGRTLASGSVDPAVKLWDAVSGRLRTSCKGHADAVESVSFSSDGQMLASGSADGTIILWSTGIVANTPPSVSVQSPSEGQAFTYPGLDVVVQARDSDGSVTEIRLIHNGSPVSAARGYMRQGSSAPAQQAFAVTLVPGINTLSATAVDDQGAVSAPQTVAISLAVEPAPAFKTYALLVATGDYDTLPDLANPVADIESVDRELREAYRCETHVLRNPTRSQFRAALHALAERQFGRDDQLLVFVTGHGFFSERIQRGYLAFRDSRNPKDDPLYETLLPHADVTEVLEALDCRHVLLVVDSCFAGTLDRTLAMAPRRDVEGDYAQATRSEFLRRKMEYATRRYITAGAKEYVPDGRPGQHSPFTRAFLEALRSFGGTDGILTLEEIHGYLERVVPQPRWGELRGNEPGSSFVLIPSQ